MLHRIPEGLRGLAREIAARKIGDGAGDHDGQLAAKLLEHLFHRETRGLGVQRIEHRLDEDGIGAAFDQAARLRGVGVDQRIEADIAETGIVHIGRDGGGAVGGADGAGDEARLIGRLLGPRVGRLAGDFRRRDIHLIGDVLEAVIRLADGLGVEGVGLDDVGAGFQIGVVDLADDLGLGEHEEIVVALEIARVLLEARAAIAGLVQLVALDHGAHGAIQDEDALLGFALQRGNAFFTGHDAAFAAANAFAGRKPSKWQMA